MYFFFAGTELFLWFSGTEQCRKNIGSVLHQDEGGIGKSIPDAQEISRDPKDYPRAKTEGNLEG